MKKIVKKKEVKKKRITLPQAKKEAWRIFSQYVRMRDGLKTTGSTEWALCVTCRKRYHIKLLQAGHFIPGRHSSNLFSEKGVNAQCYNCNVNLKGNVLVYRRKLIEMYGEGVDLELEAEARKIKKFTVGELVEMATEYKKKIHELELENGVNFD